MHVAYVTLQHSAAQLSKKNQYLLCPLITLGATKRVFMKPKQLGIHFALSPTLALGCAQRSPWSLAFVLSCPLAWQDLNPTRGSWETSKARSRLSPVCQLFVRSGCCLSAFWSEDRQGGVRVWMLHIAVLVLGLLTQAGEVGPCGAVTGGREELREMFLFFWLIIWRRDGKLPQISDTVTKARHSPSSCWAVTRRAVPVCEG